MDKAGHKYFTPAPYEPRLPLQRKLELKSPPTELEKGFLQWLVQWGTVIIGLLTLTATVFFATFGSALLGQVVGSGNLQLIVLAGIGIGLGSVLTGVTVYASNSKKRRDGKAYIAYLDDLTGKLETDNAEFVKKLHWIDPSPHKLYEVVAEGKGRYLWERQPNHVATFLRVRIGTEPSRKGIFDIQSGYSNDSQLEETELSQALKRFNSKIGTVQDTPGLVSLRDSQVFGIAGPRQQSYELANALLCQIATHHSPDNVRMMVFAPPERARGWFWAGWLPHLKPLDPDVQRPSLIGAPEDIRDLSNTLKEILNRRQDKMRNGTDLEKANVRLPYIVVVVDSIGALAIERGLLGRLLNEGAAMNIFTVFLASSDSELPPSALAFVVLDEEGSMRVVMSKTDGTQLINSRWKADAMPAEEADYLARELAPFEVAQAAGNFVLPNSVNFFEVLKWSKVDGERVAANWREKPRANLESILGLKENGQPMVIDLDEAVNGTHGVLAGATGSGKGVLLSTFVTSLALNNHPNRVNFVLADFKGGATFRVFETLPHTVGLVTDAVDEFGLSRFLISLQQELKRRKLIIDNAQRRYGNQVQKIRDYEDVAPDEVFPFLLVIIDEFAELARTAPEMMEQLVVIAQQGRSLGVFMLLSMQTLETLKGAIVNNMRYRLALRMAQKSDSKELVGDEAAANISGRNRGRAYFRCDDELSLFQTASLMSKSLAASGADGAKDTPDAALVTRLDPGWRVVTGNEMKVIGAGKPSPLANGFNPLARTDLEVAVEACNEGLGILPLRGQLFRPWLPPLPGPLALPDFMPGLFDLQSGGFGGWPEQRRWLSIPVGQLDRYWEQSQPVLYSEFSRGRNLAFMGVQDSGRTPALLAGILGLAATHRPEELDFVFIDFGSTLTLFKGLPHNYDFYNSQHFKEIGECLDALVLLLEKRRTLFSNLPTGGAVKDIEEYRQFQTAQGVPLEEQVQAVMVVIDNFTTWAQTHPDFYYEVLPKFRNLVQNGGLYGINFMLTADKPIDVASDSLAANFHKVLLRMDPGDMGVSLYNKKIVGAWQGRAGRGFLENVPPYNVVEIQAMQPTAAPEAEQLGRLQEVVANLNAAYSRSHPVEVA